MFYKPFSLPTVIFLAVMAAVAESREKKDRQLMQRVGKAVINAVVLYSEII